MKAILSLLTLVLASSLAAKAQLITVNFDAPGSGVYGGTNYSGPGADTNGVTTEYWNPMVDEGTTGASLAANGITTTGITFSDTSEAAYGTGSGSTTLGIYNPSWFISRGTDTETFNNVPAGTYDLYIYGQNGSFANRGGTYELGSTTQYIENTGDQSSFIAGVNYTEYTDITLNSTGSISFTYAPPPTVPGEGDLSGVQLVEIATPEPSTYAMMLGGLALLGFCVRRKAALLS